MASITATTSSLGDTTLRGYGGMASGIDRDAIIQQMTLKTNTKITNKEGDVQNLKWKQEAYRSLSDQMIDLQDNYFSFGGDINLKYSTAFAKNQITTQGDSDVTQFVKASGTSDMIDYLSILGVKQLASSATRMSEKKGNSPIATELTEAAWNSGDSVYTSSRLEGTKLQFGSYTDGKFHQEGSFTFPTQYDAVEWNDDGTPKMENGDFVYATNEDGSRKKATIDYTSNDLENLVKELNVALKQNVQMGDDKVTLQFGYADGKLSMKFVDESNHERNDRYVINSNNTGALAALGMDTSGITSGGVTAQDFNSKAGKLEDSYVSTMSLQEYLVGKSLSVTYDGQTKTIDLLKSTDKENLHSFAGKTDLRDEDGNLVKDSEGNNVQVYASDSLLGLIQGRLDKAFGSGKVKVDLNGDGELTFNTLADASGRNKTLTINGDADLLKKLGLENKASNKVNTESSLWENREKLGLVKADGSAYESKEELNEALKSFSINGVTIGGLSADTSVNDMISIINKNKDAGVKASYLSGENQFVLVASQTGSGRKITLGGSAKDIFGGSGEGASNLDGKDAVVEVSYGNGMTSTISSSTNTFSLEGLSVTVTGTFGYKKDENGNYIGTDGNVTTDVSKYVRDNTQAVTFSAKADVDGVTEKVKKFFEDFNKMVEEVNKQITTRHDRDYGPLTSEQKDEMDEESIENWENKAKEGLLYSDNIIRSLSMDVQSVISNFMYTNNISYEDLQEIGISYSDDYLDGGTITFDESKFREAMTNNPDKVSDIFAGGGSVKKGLSSLIEDTLTPYATRYSTRNGGSNGFLIEEAGSEKFPRTIENNTIYRQLKDMQEQIDRLKEQLKSEEDRYIKQFTTMETLINQYNSQSSYLSSLQG